LLAGDIVTTMRLFFFLSHCAPLAQCPEALALRWLSHFTKRAISYSLSSQKLALMSSEHTENDTYSLRFLFTLLW